MNNLLKSLRNMFNHKPVNGHLHESIEQAPVPAAIPEAAIAEPAGVPEDLFVEKEPPVSPEPVAEKQPANKLGQFLARNYRSLGHADGYRYHSVDILDNYRRCLRSEFREAVDHVLDDLNAYRSILQLELINARSLSPTTTEKYTMRIQSVEEDMQRLLQEKELSAGDEGLVMSALHEYRDGFLRGMEEHADEILLMGNTGIFK